jgi:hypothetical protein
VKNKLLLAVLFSIFAFSTAWAETSLLVNLAVGSAAYTKGQTVNITARVTKNGVPITSSSKREIRIYNPSGSKVLESSFPAPATAGTYMYSYKLPANATVGQWRVRARFEQGDASGSANAYFNVTQTAPVDTTPPTVSISPAAGNFTSSFLVTLAMNEAGSIYFTTNGSEPTSASTKYSSPFSVNSSTTVKYFAVDAAGNASASKSAVYTITPSADTTSPVTSVSPAAGTYQSGQLITLTANEAATIYYTTNNATPTTSSAVYSAPIQVSTTTTIKYFARDASGNNEAVKSATFTIAPYSGKTHDPANSAVVWNGYGTCAGCHNKQANDVYQSVHYQWKGQAGHMTTGPASQGKLEGLDGSSAINAYCINVLGNWNSCASCHNGTGGQPVATATPSASQLAAVDCLTCHKNPAIATPYERIRNAVTGLFEPKTGVDMNNVVRTVILPTRSNCLECHAKAGGGDAVKRGDMALASGTTSDKAYDVHMAKSGANLSCQSCHTTTNHKITGHGTDLRASDTTTQVSCSTSSCHSTKASLTTGHTNKTVSSHVGRVACQTCHINKYGKNANDSSGSEATEIHRDWRISEYNAVLGRYEPQPTKANDLIPKYAFWNGKAWGNNLNDVAVLDPATGAYKISRPVGAINDPVGTKMYPFKYKTSDQPYDPASKKLIGLSTKTYFATGNYEQAVLDGAANQGLSGLNWVTVKADEYQLLNHQVAPAVGNALNCNDCHKNTTRMNLPAMGYAPKAANSTICKQCHGLETSNDWQWIHSKHVTDKKYDCSWCHTFSRKSERGLK